MKRSVDNIFRIVGLMTCIGLVLMEAVQFWGYWNLLLVPYHLPIGTLLEFLSKSLVGPMGADWKIFASLLYLCILLSSGVIFSIAFWLRTGPSQRTAGWIVAGLLSTQIVIGLLVNPELLVLVAVELCLILPLRRAFIWFSAIVGIYVAITLMYLIGVGYIRQIPDTAARVSKLFLNLGLQGVFFVIGYLAAEEKRRRIKLAAGHAELLATQLLLGDAVRSSERARIAHDVHEALGNHLTALNLQLELAMREAGGGAIESVKTARELARHLLADVRNVVSVERADQGINLQQAVRTLCSGIPFPKITLSFDGDVDIFAPAVAHTAFRSIQEATSNAVRHSGAAALQIALFKSCDGLSIAISDNGKGVHKENAGNGLRGMRERVEELGGKLESGNQPQGGFGLQIWLPLSEGMQ